CYPPGVVLGRSPIILGDFINSTKTANAIGLLPQVLCWVEAQYILGDFINSTKTANAIGLLPA
ncbi:MAG: hypothetical protein AB1566_05480, partial [Chloroflexota bacterium]